MTWNNKSIHKLYAFALAAVFALTLAGCGGGGSAAVDPDPPAMPDPTPQEQCEGAGGRYNADGSCTSAADLAEEMALSGAQEAAMAAYTAAMAAVGGAVDPVAMTKAQMYAGMAKDASEAAAMATTSEMAMEYQMKAEMNRDMAMEAAGMPGLGLIMLANKVLNGDDIDNATLDGTTVPKAVNNAANVEEAIAAAGAPANTTPAEGFTNQGGVSGGTVAVISGDGTTEEVVHKASGSTFSLQIGSDDLLTGEMPSRFHTKGGFEAQDLLFPNTNGFDKTHLVVSTDIQATTKEEVYEEEAASETANDIATDDIVIGDPPGDGGDFAATWNEDPEDNNAPKAGLIYCPADTQCAISLDEDGKVLAVTGYQFSSSKDTETKVDTDHLAWGFWVTASIRDTLTGVAETDYEAQAGAFAYGSMPFTVPNTLSGKATYNGVANGLYSAGGMVQYFDADAMLEADFGGATNVGGKISGSISNVMAAGQAVDGSLTLMRTDINADGTFGIGTDAGDTGNTDGVLGGTGFRGRWAGQLFGPPGRNAAAMVTTFPTGAAGTFSASTQDNKMSLIGAFGAHKQ